VTNVVESSLSLLISSMEGNPRGLQRRSAPTPQAGDSLWTKGPPLRGVSAKEGTSGAAERILLRGRVREAALLEMKRKHVSGAEASRKRGRRWVESIDRTGHSGR